MRLGKIVATGIAEDVLDASVEESLPGTANETETETARVVVVAPVPAQAGSSAER
ncbi:hypothetical protein ABIA32_001792 [Streptacidiphilus sp. MAP12-20]|uniref:hypothetical protein n=1 Tax=Streptacidiphilus sp. MAP12-20 TaxID=3156299 RepID=UPI003517A65E